jgi:RAQPRD family integrative conjugative element protein
MNKKINLIFLIICISLFSTSCSSSTFSIFSSNNKEEVDKNIREESAKSQNLTNWGEMPHKNAVTTQTYTYNNWNNANELLALKKLEKYLRNSSAIIREAKSLSQKNSRYKFNYQAITRDISDISIAINSYINQDLNNQTPRSFRPLSKRY